MAEIPKRRVERRNVSGMTQRQLRTLKNPISTPELTDIVAKPLDGSFDTRRNWEVEGLVKGLSDLNPKIGAILKRKQDTAEDEDILEAEAAGLQGIKYTGTSLKASRANALQRGKIDGNDSGVDIATSFDQRDDKTQTYEEHIIEQQAQAGVDVQGMSPAYQKAFLEQFNGQTKSFRTAQLTKIREANAEKNLTNASAALAIDLDAIKADNGGVITTEGQQRLASNLRTQVTQGLITQAGADDVIIAAIQAENALGKDELLTAYESAGPTKDGTPPRRDVPAFKRKLAAARLASNTQARLNEKADEKADNDIKEQGIRDFVQSKEMQNAKTKQERDKLWRDYQRENNLDKAQYLYAKTIMASENGTGDEDGKNIIIDNLLHNSELMSESEYYKSIANLNPAQRVETGKIYSARRKEEESSDGQQRSFSRRAKTAPMQDAYATVASAGGMIGSGFELKDPQRDGFRKEELRKAKLRFNKRVLNGEDKVVTGKDGQGNPILKGIDEIAKEERDRAVTRMSEEEQLKQHKDLRDMDFNDMDGLRAAYSASKENGRSYWTLAYTRKQFELMKKYSVMLKDKQANSTLADQQRANNTN